MFRPPPPSDPESPPSVTYMSVKDAVEELRTANLYNKHHEIPSARLSPDWALVHREEQMRLTGHSSMPSPNGRSASVPPMRSGSQRSASVSPMRSGHRAGSDHWATESSTSSVPSHRYQERGQTSGGFSPRGLNSPSTYSYGAEPLNPGATNNEASRVGSLSMFSSQAMSGKISSASFGFGTATREQSMQLYISPAHMRANHGRFSPGPAAYGGNSSLSRQAHNPSLPTSTPAPTRALTTPLPPRPPTPSPTPPKPPLCPSCIEPGTDASCSPLTARPAPPLLLQVLSSKHSYQSSSFGLEERFDPQRRFALATCTPGPGAYRV